MTLSEQLRREALERGLCDQWRDEWEENPTKQDLIRKYISGIDFCIMHDWPRPYFVKRHFGGIMHDFNIFVDEEVDLDEAEGTIVLLGKCHGAIRARHFSVCDIYILHDSDVRISAWGVSVVFVNADKAATVKCTKHENAKISEFEIKTGEANGRN